ncbi:MAG TPA: cytochrome ubiquinol oxidase subunit I, partial [Steroidobacteraceae bacterium]|nr:cytochrome ubiquinol oxidase subunit I [Steroidobacteraceae bacterium]
ILAGDLSGLEVHENQPVKLAAIEGHWETHRGAPLILFALPNQQEERNEHEIAIPKLGSLIITHSLDGEVKGLKEFAPADRPPVTPVFWAFRVMVAIGFLMLALVTLSAIQWKRGVLAQSRLLLRWWTWMIPAGFVAVLSGWYTTEIGRQPFVIQGLLRTADAASAISAASVKTSIVVFASIYLFVFIAGTYYLLKLLRKGPQPVEDALRHPEDKRAARPLSVPEEEIEIRT